MSPASPSKIGSAPHLLVPTKLPVSVSKQYTLESLCLSEQKKNFPSLENLKLETALVFLPRLVLEIIYIVSESQTRIKGRAPMEPVTTLLRFRSTPKATTLSVCPLAYLFTPVPINLCFKVLLFITIPKAAAG